MNQCKNCKYWLPAVTDEIQSTEFLYGCCYADFEIYERAGESPACRFFISKPDCAETFGINWEANNGNTTG